MGLNANKVASAGNNVNKQEAMDAGSYPARIVQILDLGLQEQRPYQGEAKPPKHEIMLTYEFLDEFCLDEKGEELEDKPRWLSETFPFNNLDVDLAKSTKRYKALDPKEDLGGDFTLLADVPCVVTVVNKDGTGKHKGTVFNNVGGVSGMRAKDAAKADPLKNPTKVFVLDEPDLEVFRSLPDFLQDKIKGNLEFNGSILQKALGGNEKVEGKEEAPKAKAKEEKDAPEDEEGEW
jgi:hypothetical protein